MTESLKKKVDQAIRFLKSINADEIELAYSGGKDSDVILELAKMAGIQYRAIYKNTTIDPPGTIEHVLSKGVEILRPKESFAKLIQKKGFPSRYRRFCCSELKEYPGMIKYYVRNGAIYLKNKPKGKIFKTFQGDVYAWLCKEVFTGSTYEFDLRFKGLFPVDCKEFLENYFNVKL